MNKQISKEAQPKSHLKTDKPVEKIENYPKLYIIGLAVGVLLLIPTLLIAHVHHFTGLQLKIFRDFNNLSNSFKTPSLWLTEGLGAGYAIAACVLIAALYKRYKLAWRFFFTAAAAGVLLEVGKIIAKEPRPAVLLHGNLHIRAVELGLNSFPSGHEAMATALALTLWMILPKRLRWLAILWILVVGATRLYVGDHTPNDVVGGFATGLIAVCAIRLMPKKYAQKLHLDTKGLLDTRF